MQAHIANKSWTETPWTFVSFLLWLVLIVGVVYLLILTLFYLWPRYEQLDTAAYKKRYSFILHFLNLKDNKLSMLYHLSYFLRRIVLAVVAVYLNHQPTFQIFILIAVDLAAVMIQGLVRPRETTQRNRR